MSTDSKTNDNKRFAKTVTRRAALAAVLTAPTLSAMALPTADDAELIALEKEFDAAVVAYDRKYNAIERAPDWEPGEDEVHDIVGEIMDTPAVTMEGLKVKAKAAWWIVGDEWRGRDENYDHLGCGETALLIAFLKDLLGEAVVA